MTKGDIAKRPDLPKVSDGTLAPVLKKLIEWEKQGKIRVRKNV